MKGEATEKIVGGKLLVIKSDFGTKLNSVQILGDFFAHPEESIEDIEKKLCGLDLNFDEKKAKKMLDELIAAKHYELIGMDTDAIIRVLKKSTEAKG